MKARNFRHLLLTAAVLFGAASCDDDVQRDVFRAIPVTETGKKLVENTDLIATVYSDSSYTLRDGVTVTEFAFLSMEGYATRIFINEIDLTKSDLTIKVSTPDNKPAFGRQRMTLQALHADAEGHRVVAGINGDFFNADTGVPQGILYKGGVALKTTVTDAVNTWFAINDDGLAMIGDQAMYDGVKHTFVEALGGRVQLINDGVILPQTDERREPRTCVGVSQDGTKVYFFAVDGRNYHYSNGMKYTELAKVLKALGAYDAINLDGGGSTTFFIRRTSENGEGLFDIRNWPYDLGGVERAVANGLLIISQN